ncbi:hypothetical protein E1B28_000283 [Marasmius oreades]|uniref:Uncharacterized protein n=1 Tax=Marasmius oreades TaxID=181124 RepID=A0A9P8AE70_9AGAR|nr:uncharacterized protein E1B28_000283 [Marasmius oreades]KAG7098322.1 hypothetical protein E1B28_000283 [Marasmius oreades]
MLPATVNTVRKTSKDSTVTVTMITAKFARDNSQQQVPPSSLASMSGTYEPRADDYTFNALNTFSFGNPTPILDPSTSSSSLSLTPEQESPTTIHVDVTPRPSVVGTAPAHQHYHQRWNKPSSTRNSDNDEEDQNRKHRDSSSKASMTTGRFSDLSPSTSQSASAVSLEERQQVEFSSDDDFGYDYDDDDDGPELSLSGIGERYEMEGLTSISEGQPPSAADLRAWRRGSLPGPTALNVAVSNSTAVSDNSSYHRRDREASVATLRKSSKSLEHGLRISAPVDGANSSSHKSAIDPSSSPVLFSSPFSSSGADSPRIRGPLVTQSVDPRTPLPPLPQSPDSQSPVDNFGFDLAYITQGITSFDDSPISPVVALSPTSQFNDFVARRPSLTPSTASGPKSPKWWNTWGFPRRHSAASTGSGENMERTNGGSMFLYDDSFSKGLLRWGGEGYREQRKEWCFRRVPEIDRESEGEKRVGDDEDSQSSASGTSPVDEKEKERQRARAKERAKQRDRRAPENWRGMVIGAEELWMNDLVGNFTVSREEVIRKGTETSGKTPQQRLIVRGSRKRTKAENRRRELQHPPVIVHKHSRALAFSLSRYYKSSVNSTVDRHSSSTASTVTRRPTTPASNGRSTASGLILPMPSQKSAARVILLAPRKVQEAFTSTTTTKLLAEHGLLQAGGEDAVQGDRNYGRRKSAVASAPASTGDASPRQRSKSVSGSTPNSVNDRKKDKDSSSSNGPASSLVPPLPPPPVTAPVPSEPANSFTALAPPSTSAPLSNFSESVSGTSTRDLKIQTKGGWLPDSTPASENHSRGKGFADGDNDSYDSQDNDDLNPTSSSHYSSSTGETSVSGFGYTVDSDDTDDDLLVPFRTPHRETYGTVDINAYEHHHTLFVHPAPQTDSRSGLGLLDRLRSRGGRQHHGAIGVATMQPFDPPWMTFEPRGKQEQQKKVVDNLNMSFKDVGLLPSTPRERNGSPFGRSQVNSGKVAKRKTGASTMPSSLTLGKGRKRRDVFENIPPEALYMLLPLWPGDTDNHSQRHYPFIRPHVPLEKRRFLLVCYKALDPKNNPEASSTTSSKSKSTAKTSKPGKTDGGSVTSSTTSSRGKGKLGSKISSTSSTDSRHWDEKNILLAGFLITARQVTYADLQGSGVRMPEEGLAVSGPLEDAFRQMPFSLSDEYTTPGRRRASWSSTSDDFHGGMLDLVLGVCYSRESGVEFDPEGLVSLGLCTVLNPLPKGTVAEELGEQGTKMHQVKLTPIGMAVMEMAWIGGMALMSFGPS